jgi:hypothetical protein
VVRSPERGIHPAVCQVIPPLNAALAAYRCIPRHRARRHEFGRFRYINQGWIAYPAQPYCPLSLRFPFKDMAQYQKSYWPNTHPNSQPLGMSFF